MHKQIYTVNLIVILLCQYLLNLLLVYACHLTLFVWLIVNYFVLLIFELE